MKYQKGAAVVWAIGLLILVIIAGAAYWQWSQNVPSTTVTPTQQTPISVQNSNSENQVSSSSATEQSQSTAAAQTPPAQAGPTATIDQSSLVSTTTPKLSGTVSGTSEIAVEVWPGVPSLSQMQPSESNQPFWGDNTEIRDSEVSVVSGRWSTAIGSSEVAGLGGPIPYMPTGTYTVAVYDLTTWKILTTGTLQITGPSIYASNAGADTISFQYIDLPQDSQVLLTQGTNPSVVATVTGTGSSTITVPGGLDGTYWLQVELNGDKNDILQSGPISANWISR